MLFGSAPGPCFLKKYFPRIMRPWLPALKTKLSDRDKMRIKKHTAKGKLAKTYYNREGVKRVCGP